MESIIYRTLELPSSDDVFSSRDLSLRTKETLAVYDQINGRDYQSADDMPFGRAVELLEEFDEQECRIAYDREMHEVAGVINFRAKAQNNWVWVDGLSVRRDYQSLGIGRDLLHEAERYAVSRHLGFTALRSIQSAIPFYEKQGYEQHGEARNHQPVLTKRLIVR